MTRRRRDQPHDVAVALGLNESPIEVRLYMAVVDGDVDEVGSPVLRDAIEAHHAPSSVSTTTAGAGYPASASAKRTGSGGSFSMCTN